MRIGRPLDGVSIPSRPRGRLQVDREWQALYLAMFQSPAGPVAGCRAATRHGAVAGGCAVSIPSRPRGRLQG